MHERRKLYRQRWSVATSCGCHLALHLESLVASIKNCPSDLTSEMHENVMIVDICDGPECTGLDLEKSKLIKETRPLTTTTGILDCTEARLHQESQ